MKWEKLVELGRELPDVEEGTWYGTPALKVRGKGFLRLKEDGISVVFMLDSIDQQDELIVAKPAIYHITDHYLGHASVLARLSALTISEARARLAQSWRVKAPVTTEWKLNAFQPNFESGRDKRAKGKAARGARENDAPRGITVDEARVMALSLPGANERDHWGKPSWRVKDKIFATLWVDEQRAVLKLQEADKESFPRLRPTDYGWIPWGENRWMTVDLTQVEKETFRDLLVASWKRVAPRKLAERWDQGDFG